jgi:hypothetical protein
MYSPVMGFVTGGVLRVSRTAAASWFPATATVMARRRTTTTATATTAMARAAYSSIAGAGDVAGAAVAVETALERVERRGRERRQVILSAVDGAPQWDPLTGEGSWTPAVPHYWPDAVPREAYDSQLAPRDRATDAWRAHVLLHEVGGCGHRVPNKSFNPEPRTLGPEP